jgi:hypothetical protein
MRAWVTRVAVSILLIWCVVTALDAMARAKALQDDGRRQLELELEQLAGDLPPRGIIGYVDARSGDPSMEMALHVGQFAIAPRLIRAGSGPEWLIVRTEATGPAGDPRLTGYEAVGGAVGSHRIYRRIQ